MKRYDNEIWTQTPRIPVRPSSLTMCDHCITHGENMYR